MYIFCCLFLNSWLSSLMPSMQNICSEGLNVVEVPHLELLSNLSSVPILVCKKIPNVMLLPYANKKWPKDLTALEGKRFNSKVLDCRCYSSRMLNSDQMLWMHLPDGTCKPVALTTGKDVAKKTLSVQIDKPSWLFWAWQLQVLPKSLLSCEILARFCFLLGRAI